MKTRDGFYLRQALPALAVTVTVFLLPIGAVFLRAFSAPGELAAVVTDRYTWRLLLFTMAESGLSALCSVVLAMPFALFFSRYSFRGRRALLAMSDAAFALPAILAVLGFVICYGNNGLLNKALGLITQGRAKASILYSFKAIILAHVYLNFPVAFSLITTALSSMPDTEEKASRLLGAGEMKTFFRVTLPRIWQSVLAAFTLIFLFCFPSFLIVMTLGGNPRFYTLEAEIYRRTYTDARPASSAALALFSFAVMAVLLLVTGYGSQDRKVSRKARILEKTKGSSRIWAIVLSALIVLFIAPPMLSILYRSFFTKDGVFTLKAWKDIISGARPGAGTAFSKGIGTSMRAIINSIAIALVSSLATVKMASSIAMCSARRNSTFIPLLTMLPMAVGSVTSGLGYAFVSANLPLRNIVTAYLMVLLAHMVVTIPFAVKTLLPGARKIPVRLVLAAKTLGKDTKEAYRLVEKPLLAPYRRRAFAFSFALSLGEVNATLALGEGKVTTVPVLIYKMINQYNYQGASALAVILLAVAIAVFAIGETGETDNALS